MCGVEGGQFEIQSLELYDEGGVWKVWGVCVWKSVVWKVENLRGSVQEVEGVRWMDM